MAAGEFNLIKELLAPLAKGVAGAFELGDDAAFLESSDYIVSKDLLVEGVHFPKGADLGAVAKRSLRVNLSDLAAKGAKPFGYFLGCVWPKGTDREDVAAFADALLQDQETFKLKLLGGDTTVHKAAAGPLTISITAVGKPARGGMIVRHGAKEGNDLYVSGTIGDAKLGLLAEQKPSQVPTSHREYFLERFWCPSPRLGLGWALSGVASAAIDISDGLIGDIGHIAARSKVGILIESHRIPISEALAEYVSTKKNKEKAILDAAAFGDDYEIAFTAPQSLRRSVEMASNLTKTPITRIGSVKNGEGVTIVDEQGDFLEIEDAGFDHFA